MTIGELLNYGFDHLIRSGIPEAVLEAELLLEYVMDKERIYLHLNRNQNVSEAIQEKYQSYIADRCRHRPLQYIVGQTEFYGLKFTTDKRALIPRPETEILVEEVLENWQPRFRTILDIGTGSGAIAVALAKHLASVRITVTDQSPGGTGTGRDQCEELWLGRQDQFGAGRSYFRRKIADSTASYPTRPIFPAIRSPACSRR